jgi:hypothetical protein
VEWDKGKSERREAELKKINDEREELSKIVESLNKTIDEAKVDYLGGTDESRAKMIKQIKDLEGRRKEHFSLLKRIEKRVAKAAVDFLNFFTES